MKLDGLPVGLEVNATAKRVRLRRRGRTSRVRRGLAVPAGPAEVLFQGEAPEQCTEVPLHLLREQGLRQRARCAAAERGWLARWARRQCGWRSKCA
jgi:hypothetical protein